MRIRRRVFVAPRCVAFFFLSILVATLKKNKKIQSLHARYERRTMPPVRTAANTRHTFFFPLCAARWLPLPSCACSARYCGDRRTERAGGPLVHE